MGICPFAQFTIFYTILSVFARFFAQFQTAFYRLVNDNYRVGKEKMILRGDFQLSGRIGNTCLSVLSRQLNLNTGVPHSLYFFYLSLIIVTPTLRKTERGKALYAKRKESIECVFGDAKEKHAMRYTHHRGLARVTNWVTLKFACMNLKKLATCSWDSSNFFCFFARFFNSRLKCAVPT